jgi:hypothetical protein
MAAKLRQFIQAEDAVVGPRHFAGQRHLASADQADGRDGAMGGVTRARGDDGSACAGAAGGAVEVGGLEGFSQGQRWQGEEEAEGQHRRARPRGPEEHTL